MILIFLGLMILTFIFVVLLHFLFTFIQKLVPKITLPKTITGKILSKFTLSIPLYIGMLTFLPLGVSSFLNLGMKEFENYDQIYSYILSVIMVILVSAILITTLVLWALSFKKIEKVLPIFKSLFKDMD